MAPMPPPMEVIPEDEWSVPLRSLCISPMFNKTREETWSAHMRSSTSGADAVPSSLHATCMPAMITTGLCIGLHVIMTDLCIPGEPDHVRRIRL